MISKKYRDDSKYLPLKRELKVVFIVNTGNTIEIDPGIEY